MSLRQHVLLIPGFFGFVNVGDFAYYHHVRDILVEEYRRRRLEGEIRVVKTLPTASVRRRAVRVLETIAEVTEAAAGPVHLIGHSSGGLDIRLCLSPGANLPTELDVERYAVRVRTAVSLSSPHRGSPLAGFLDTVFGRQILRYVSLFTMYTLRTGRVPIAALFRLVHLLSLRQLPIAAGTLLNNIYRDLLADFSPERREAIEDLLRQVGGDQALLQELSVAGMRRMSECLRQRPGVRYGSVVSCTPPPGLRTMWATGAAPFRQATHALFAAFYRITARMPSDVAEALTSAQAAALRQAYGRLPEPGDNDGMVPTLSQVFGEVVHATWADHLDVIGHFYLPSHVPGHFDWLNSGSRFQLPAFERLWSDVGRFLFEA